MAVGEAAMGWRADNAAAQRLASDSVRWMPNSATPKPIGFPLQYRTINYTQATKVAAKMNDCENVVKLF